LGQKWLAEALTPVQKRTRHHSNFVANIDGLNITGSLKQLERQKTDVFFCYLEIRKTFGTN